MRRLFVSAVLLQCRVATIAARAFPTAYIITMTRVAERVANARRLQRLHPALNAHIWPATTPGEIASAKMLPYVNTKTKRLRTDQVGCAISHLKVLERFVMSGNESLIIFEDDIVMDPQIETKLKTFLRHMPPDNEFSQFLHHKHMKALRRQPRYKHLDPFILKSYAPYGTTGYFVTRGGVQTILKHSKPIWWPIDEMMRALIKNGKLKSYMPSDDLITMPYKLKSTVWTTSPKGAPFWHAKDQCGAFRTLWTPDLWDEYATLLKWTHGTFSHHKVDYAIIAGTALGYKRFKAFLPWDDDVDIAVRKRDLTRAEAAVSLPHCSARFWGGLKIFKCNSPKAGNCPWRYPFIDVFTYAAESWFPVRTVPFLSFDVNVPRNLDDYLKGKFGDTSICLATQWDHKHERSRSYASGEVRNASLHRVLKNCDTDLQAKYYPLLNRTVLKHPALNGVASQSSRALPRRT